MTASDPLTSRETGASATVRAINEAAGEVDAAFIAELHASHGAPEWDRPAPMHLNPYDV